MTRSVSTYDDDFFAWTQEQAAALRTIPAGMAGNGVDIVHVAEEIEDLGKRDLREVCSHFGRLFEHLIKIALLPKAREVSHWRSEAAHLRNSAADAFSPSMRQLIDVDALWARSVKRARKQLRPVEAHVTEDCPFDLDQLLSEDFEIDAALTKLTAAPADRDAS